jgi:hypothetical protein
MGSGEQLIALARAACEGGNAQLPPVRILAGLTTSGFLALGKS